MGRSEGPRTAEPQTEWKRPETVRWRGSTGPEGGSPEGGEGRRGLERDRRRAARAVGAWRRDAGGRRWSEWLGEGSPEGGEGRMMGYGRWEDISGLSTAQTLELCDPEVLLFQEPLQNSEVTSTSNCCHEDTSCHFFKTTYKNSTEITAATDGCSLPELIFDNDIYVSKDFALSSFIPPIFPNSYQGDQLSLLDQSQSFSQEAAVVNGLPAYPPDDHFAPIEGPTIMPSLLGERCLSLMPNPYMRLTSFLGSANTVLLGPYLPCNLSSSAVVLSDDKYSGIFNGSTDYVGTRVQNHQDLEVLQGDHNGGIFSSDPLPGIYGSSGPLPGIYDSSTVLQYACRKTLADRRPRVRGRFARNDEFLCHETPRGSYNGNNEEDTDENVSDSGRDA
ncbi:hypothetical protein RHGRI_011902 [Rhododendron griersonianum]|uniref:CCT domain-containing protein n=1 Tax=Rhododendron griersonianum TaxID=479676 RepID=A0AAV6KP34_9ERIC|nr:hypothetical protein RHGRI_011902 [Rhododendron griersonianum]